jgi:hypothetical protein
VIGCEGYRTGDRVSDLVTLAFCLSVAECPAAAQDGLRRQTRADREKVIADAYIAHQAMQQVDRSIRHRTPSEVTTWTSRSRELLS